MNIIEAIRSGKNFYNTKLGCSYTSFSIVHPGGLRGFTKSELLSEHWEIEDKVYKLPGYKLKILLKWARSIPVCVASRDTPTEAEIDDVFDSLINEKLKKLNLE